MNSSGLPSRIVFECPSCGNKIALELIGGQYQDEYRGNCDCGRKWFLKELTEAFYEICNDQ